VLPAGSLLADFSFEQTSRITGGMMAGMMKVAGVFSKSAREPMRTTVAVKGDRMVHWSPTQATVMDLAKETITNIDFQKKQYSVMTFAEMAQVMEQAARKMQDARKEGQGEVQFKVSVDNTGQTKQIAGFEARQMIMKMIMEGTDQKSGEKGSLAITTDLWIAPRVTGYEEIAEFHKRMAQKLTWTPNAGALMMGRSDMAKGMAEVYKEAAKLDGTPVLQIVRMGAEGQPGQAGAAGSTPPPAQQEQQQAERPSVGGALGGALGGRLGRFGGLGRRKKEEPKQEQAQQPPQQAPAGQRADASGALLEMTTEMSNFSAAAVDDSKFDVPSGFKQVESGLKKMR
jgi:hypothetical protein